MPSLENLKQEFANDPFEVVTIDVEEEREDVQDFMESKKYSFTVLLDTDGYVSARYGVRVHPMKFLIDPSGKIVGQAVGFREWDSEAMKMLIKKISQGDKAEVKTAHTSS